MQPGSIFHFLLAASLTIIPAMAGKHGRDDYDCTVIFRNNHAPERQPIVVHTYYSRDLPIELDGVRHTIQLSGCTPEQSQIPQGYSVEHMTVSKYYFTTIPHPSSIKTLAGNAPRFETDFCL